MGWIMPMNRAADVTLKLHSVALTIVQLSQLIIIAL